MLVLLLMIWLMVKVRPIGVKRLAVAMDSLKRALADLAVDLSYCSDIYCEFFFPVYH